MNFQAGEYLYIRDPEASGQSELIPAHILWNANGQVTIEIESVHKALGEQEELLVFFTVDRTFMQQAAKVMAVADEAEPVDCPLPDDSRRTSMGLTDDADLTLLTVEPQGEAVSAENRECYRIQSHTEIFATVNDEVSGRLADISQTGFAAVCDADLPEGSIVRVSLYKDDVSVCGPARIQSKRRMPDGQYRYGLLCVERSMQQDCGRVAMMVQRENLKRRSYAN